MVKRLLSWKTHFMTLKAAVAFTGQLLIALGPVLAAEIWLLQFRFSGSIIVTISAGPPQQVEMLRDFLTVLAFNLFGDGLRDALDPKSRR